MFFQGALGTLLLFDAERAQFEQLVVSYVAPPPPPPHHLQEDHRHRRDPAISGDGEATSSSEKCRLVDVYGAHLLRLLALLPAVLEHEREGAPGLGLCDSWGDGNVGRRRRRQNLRPSSAACWITSTRTTCSRPFSRETGTGEAVLCGPEAAQFHAGSLAC